MKLYPSEPKVRIYEEGFGNDDILNRKPTGERLSELLERVEDPTVIALHGLWGTGKSHFLKRWVGAHTLENGGQATTVYFDAFANDYFDDPLIAITGAISDRLRATKDVSKWEVAKRQAAKLARPAFRIGVAALTAGASELSGPLLDAALAAGGKEAEQAAEAFWKREDGRKEAMRQFRSALEALTAPDEDGIARPLIVVVDELDRCRPDYALAMLEVAKHFFSVERVHFVLGVNLDALEHSVRARYGNGIDAKNYLQRFLALSVTLPDHVDEQHSLRASLKYFRTSATAMGLNQALSKEVEYQLPLAIRASDMSLRDVEKLLTNLAVLPQKNEIAGYENGWKILIVSLVLMRVMRPELFRAAFAKILTLDDVVSFYGITPAMVQQNSNNHEGYVHEAYIIRGAWEYALGEKTVASTDSSFASMFNSFRQRRPSKILESLERDFFGLFKVAD